MLRVVHFNLILPFLLNSQILLQRRSSKFTEIIPPRFQVFQNQLERHGTPVSIWQYFASIEPIRLVMIMSEYDFEELLSFWFILPRTARCWHHNNDVLLLCKLAHFNFLVVADRFSSTAASIQTNQGGTPNYPLLLHFSMFFQKKDRKSLGHGKMLVVCHFLPSFFLIWPRE